VLALHPTEPVMAQKMPVDAELYEYFDDTSNELSRHLRSGICTCVFDRPQ